MSDERDYRRYHDYYIDHNFRDEQWKYNQPYYVDNSGIGEACISFLAVFLFVCMSIIPGSHIPGRYVWGAVGIVVLCLTILGWRLAHNYRKSKELYYEWVEKLKECDKEQK